MTPEQRGAAIALMKREASGVTPTDSDMAKLLDALLSEFVVIAKDDVREEFGMEVVHVASGTKVILPEEEHYPHTHRHFVTRWERIS